MEENKILLELSMAEIMDRWPQTIPVFLKYQPYCVGCSMSGFDTLIDAAKVYEVPFEVILNELEEAVNSSEIVS